MDHVYILLTILFTVYGQIILKWQVNAAGSFPIDTTERIWFLINLLTNFWVISCFVCAFLAALSWMVAMTKFPLGYAYQFMSITYIAIPILGVLFFQEIVTMPKIIGMSLIIAGLLVIGSHT
jgi:multidrug transporter EmrE-like cation transporter